MKNDKGMPVYPQTWWKYVHETGKITPVKVIKELPRRIWIHDESVGVFETPKMDWKQSYFRDKKAAVAARREKLTEPVRLAKQNISYHTLSLRRAESRLKKALAAQKKAMSKQ